MRAVHKFKRAESGIALLTTMLLLLLMSSLLVGFILLINSGQKLSGMNNDYSKAFYAAEAGMEKLTADIGTLFNANYAPTGTQLAALQTKPPVLSGINYVKYDGTTGYIVTYPVDTFGNPAATVTQIKSGSFQGMTALATPYTLSVTARTTNGSEVKLQRTTQTVGIPMFQFGVFSDTDLSFFPGPVFNFGGRTHTNGNLFLASGSGVTLSDRVTAFKDVIRTNLSNGFSTMTGSYNGAVNIFNGSGTRPLGYNEGSLVGTVGSGINTGWSNISLGSSNYAGNLRNGATGAVQLNLGIVTLGGGTTQAIDVIRRPVVGENINVTAERYFFQASFRVLLSDNANDITSLPCVSSGAPFDLSTIAAPVANWPAGAATTLKNNMNTNNAAGLNTPPVPLAASGAVQGQTAYTVGDHNGYWLPNPAAGTVNPKTGATFSTDSGFPIIKGFIKIEIQTTYGTTTCGNWQDVTLEVLAFGYAGKNINTYGSLSTVATNLSYPASTTAKSQVTPGFSATGVNPPLLLLPTTQVASQSATGSCQDVHPNAIIRLERVRDNPSNWSTTNACGVANNATPGAQIYPTHPTDYWPNALFDVREGTVRDVSPANSLAGATTGGTTYNAINYNAMVNLGGTMNYIEIDMKNLARYLGGGTGGLPGSGHNSFDSNTAPNDFTVYVSDRRGNYTPSAITATWPPNSPSQTETGEYGFEDLVNPASTAGCMNGTMDTGEDVDGIGGTPYTYGQDPTHAMGAGLAAASLAAGQYGSYAQAGLYGASTTFAFTQYPTCTAPSTNAIWPMAYVVHANEARENPNFLFRRAVKLVNGSNLSALGTCPGAVPCGLTVSAENPIYVQGDYNCPNSCSGTTYNDPHVAASVLGDSVTLLSNNWNDVNSFMGPYNMGAGTIYRNATTTFYRTAVMGGKNISFAQPTAFTASQDFGTDGGLHNFLRYIENWGGQSLNYRGSLVSLFYSRQANSVFKCCTTVYSPPTRGYNFDTEFLTPSLLPPRTPLFRDVNTTGFTQLLLPTQ